MKPIIEINKFLPATIVTRDSIAAINDQIDELGNGEVIFSFKKIEFISRAFADEFIAMIENRKLNAEFTFMQDTVSEVFNVVKKNRKNHNRGFQNIVIARYSNQSQLENFLSLI
jgi:hypothetical protein